MEAHAHEHMRQMTMHRLRNKVAAVVFLFTFVFVVIYLVILFGDAGSYSCNASSNNVNLHTWMIVIVVTRLISWTWYFCKEVQHPPRTPPLLILILRSFMLIWFFVGWNSWQYLESDTCHPFISTAIEIDLIFQSIILSYFIWAPLLIICCGLTILPLLVRLNIITSVRFDRENALPQEQIEALPVVTFQKDTWADREHTSCAICLENYEEMISQVKLLPCKHHFHQKCTDQWLRQDKSCPMCRVTIQVPIETV